MNMTKEIVLPEAIRCDRTSFPESRASSACLQLFSGNVPAPQHHSIFSYDNFCFSFLCKKQSTFGNNLMHQKSNHHKKDNFDSLLCTEMR